MIGSNAISGGDFVFGTSVFDEVFNPDNGRISASFATFETPGVLAHPKVELIRITEPGLYRISVKYVETTGAAYNAFGDARDLPIAQFGAPGVDTSATDEANENIGIPQYPDGVNPAVACAYEWLVYGAGASWTLRVYPDGPGCSIVTQLTNGNIAAASFTQKVEIYGRKIE
jgi:hypothetical protein